MNLHKVPVQDVYSADTGAQYADTDSDSAGTGARYADTDSDSADTGAQYADTDSDSAGTGVQCADTEAQADVKAGRWKMCRMYLYHQNYCFRIRCFPDNPCRRASRLSR